MAGSESKAAKDLTAMMETTMQQLQSRFQNLSDQIISKMDEMGTRIDDLEKNVGDLMTQAGAEEQHKANGLEERPSWPKR
ncbi:heat shock factor-binding protein 1-like protein 1 [Sinocyclocheilus anshuiensis]|uniref:Heat shock factor-binding protein 1-like n=1 Tax=Sinocyclocheilus anshuiensis TaxID=1608454 RepID=A0A671SQN1_9TELE|nr:PREDICTED: heat shock factor-binding protein 1-like [Sinocyclocheilus anshuiensis]XP_016355206.1 PREDICTED: heat shock factor-binding protein 1-like [Sinocyclocheilus anshuiensis]XP_016355207.1 PREDICTED: heat shock factor-binding protein 1-like [Sinocyclocheilus anshuiensis]